MLTRLRELNYDDIPFMKEFYEDDEIKAQFRFTQRSYSVSDLEIFINSSRFDNTFHFAVESDKEYAGTISLKNCDYRSGTCEYAIVIRKKFWGRGVSNVATIKLIEYARDVLKIKSLYLFVISTNTRAKMFYKKIGFIYKEDVKNEFKNGQKVIIEKYYYNIIEEVK